MNVSISIDAPGSLVSVSGRLVLRNVPARIERLFAATRLNRVLSIEPVSV